MTGAVVAAEVGCVLSGAVVGPGSPRDWISPRSSFEDGPRSTRDWMSPRTSFDSYFSEKTDIAGKVDALVSKLMSSDGDDTSPAQTNQTLPRETLKDKHAMLF